MKVQSPLVVSDYNKIIKVKLTEILYLIHLSAIRYRQPLLKQIKERSQNEKIIIVRGII